jgi:hypothetical protein
MNCKDFKKNILPFIDDELPEQLQSNLAQHLSECSTCNAYFQNISSVYSQTGTLLNNISTDAYFYTRLKARMENESGISVKLIPRLSYLLKPAFYTLFAFTLLLSVLLITGNLNSSQQTNTVQTSQNINSEDQDYIKTIAMNDQTFEEEFINTIDK